MRLVRGSEASAEEKEINVRYPYWAQAYETWPMRTSSPVFQLGPLETERAALAGQPHGLQAGLAPIVSAEYLGQVHSLVASPDAERRRRLR